MPNQEKNKITERTCFICRTKNEKSELFRLVKNGEKLVFDQKQKMNGEGKSTYICKTSDCLQKVAKNKKLGIENEDLLKMANEVKNSKINILSILNVMKNSTFCVFGINLVFDAIYEGRVDLVVAANDISDKNFDKLEQKCLERNIEILKLHSKDELGKVYNKEDINVIAICDKKAADGILKKIGR